MKFSSARAGRLIVLVSLLYIALERQTFAYLDPGSTSYALQMVIAAMVAVAFAVKTCWAKLKSFFSGFVSPSGKSEETSDGSPSVDAPSS